MSIFMDLKGTSQASFQIQKNGPRFSNVTGTLQARNAADNAYADIWGAILKAASDSMIINADAAGVGADWAYTIARPTSGMSAALSLTLPPSAGSNGYVLTTDGSGVLSWSAPSAPAGVMKVNSTALAFGDASPKALFSLPANAVVDEVKVIVDTAFNGAPTLAIGIVGTTNKYMDTTDVDLTSGANDSWSAQKNNVAVGSIEALIATYVQGAASSGAARIVVKYY